MGLAQFYSILYFINKRQSWKKWKKLRQIKPLFLYNKIEYIWTTIFFLKPPFHFSLKLDEQGKHFDISGKISISCNPSLFSDWSDYQYILVVFTVIFSIISEPSEAFRQEIHTKNRVLKSYDNIVK